MIELQLSHREAVIIGFWWIASGIFLVVGGLLQYFMKNIQYKPFFLLFLLVTLSSSFSLQGTWAYQNKQAAAGQDEVTLTIEDFIFRGEKIMQKLIFKGCQQMLLQSQFSENQVFINPSSYLTQNIEGKSCDNVGQNPLDDIFSGLARVFYFQININELLLNDPYGATVFKFKRVLDNPAVDISGVYTMNQYSSTRTSLSVQIGPKAITFCQGMAVYKYGFPQGRNRIELTKVRNSCPSKQLTAAVQTVRYYRIKDGILDLYDQTIAIAVQMIFREAYDPEKPVFGNNRPAPPPPPRTPTIAAPPPPSKGISKTNLSGKWSIITLFDIPFPNSPYSLEITLQKIALLGGCNTYTFPYTLNSTTQTITVGQPISTRKACQNSDDQLYVSGVTKMYKYLVSSTPRGHSLNFYDTTGNIGYALQIRKAQPPRPVTPQKQEPFANGVVLMLLLNRRDLPRAVVRINGDSLTYSRCNTMTHKFIIADPEAKQGTVELSLTSRTEKACANDNDQLYIDSLNSATKYIYDSAAKTIIFSDSNGNEVVTFNRA